MSAGSKKKLGTWRMERDLVALLAQHAARGRRRKFKKNSVLYEQGERSSRFFLVLKGLVQISIYRADGSEVVLELMGPDTICGEGSAWDGLPRFSTAAAVEDTEVIEFDTSKMIEIFRESPEFAASLLRVTSLKQRVLAVRLKHLASREPQERVMELLTRLEEMFGVDHPRGRLLVTHVTHEQIATMTGTSRVTVTRTLHKLRKEGRIDILNGQILLI